jgi:hypothetical protein
MHFFKQILYIGNKMSITITSLALLASLTNITTTSASTNESLLSKTNTLSKDEIVQIIDNNQKANQTLEDFSISLPSLNISDNLRIARVTFVQKNSASNIRIKKELSSDE